MKTNCYRREINELKQKFSQNRQNNNYKQSTNSYEQDDDLER